MDMDIRIRTMLMHTTGYGGAKLDQVWQTAAGRVSGDRALLQRCVANWYTHLAAYGWDIPEFPEFVLEEYAALAELHAAAACGQCGRIAWDGTGICMTCPVRGAYVLAHKEAMQYADTCALQLTKSRGASDAMTNLIWARDHVRDVAVYTTPSVVFPVQHDLLVGLPGLYGDAMRIGLAILTRHLGGTGLSPTLLGTDDWARMQQTLRLVPVRMQQPRPHLRVGMVQVSWVLLYWAIRLLDRCIQAGQDADGLLHTVRTACATDPSDVHMVLIQLDDWLLAHPSSAAQTHADHGVQCAIQMADALCCAIQYGRPQAWEQAAQYGVEAAYHAWMVTHGSTGTPWGIAYEPRATACDVQRADLCALVDQCRHAHA